MNSPVADVAGDFALRKLSADAKATWLLQWTEMTDWVPDLTSISGPRYLAFVLALEADIAAGRVQPGMRLLPHRDMAQRLGLSVGTVSKACAEAEQRGLISGEIGRGTFVLRRRTEPSITPGTAGIIDLAFNVPPDTGESDLIAAVVGEIAATGEMSGLLGHLPFQGLRQHRETVANWLASFGVNADAEQIFITHGGRHALSLALDTIAKPGNAVLTEDLASDAVIALSVQKSYCLHGVASDAEGMLPESLDLAFSKTGARVVYCMPTLQASTGVTMSTARRQAIAAVIRKHDAYLVEDDTYAYLMAPPLAPISTLIPERSFYVTSFAECVAPGACVAAMIAPDSLLDRAINAARTAASSAVPLMADIVARLIIDGSMVRQARLKREKAALRNAIARRVLKDWLPRGPTTGFHIWLPLPATCTLNTLVTRAAQAGIKLAPSTSMQHGRSDNSGIRLCLGGPMTEKDLEHALLEIRLILE